jgi:hypothetical protein
LAQVLDANHRRPRDDVDQSALADVRQGSLGVGHNGIDIDIPNFRWMDGNVSNVLAAASGVVTGIRDTEPDRNTSCAGSANFVQVRHPDGLTAVYAHLKKGSVAVSVGQQVSVGGILGVVGSSGCSTAPHLHFELQDAANRLVDPFRNGLWAAPPIYNTVITLMDLVIAGGDMTLQQIKDPAANVQSIPRGTVLGRWRFHGGRRRRGRDQDGHLRFDGCDLLRHSPDIHNGLPALLLVLERGAAIDSGSVDRFHPREWRAGSKRDGDRHIGAARSTLDTARPTAP